MASETFSFSIYEGDLENLQLMEELKIYGKRNSKSRSAILLESINMYKQKYAKDIDKAVGRLSKMGGGCV